jgi:DNA-binding MurR/RpiR family transcriptional regulator
LQGVLVRLRGLCNSLKPSELPAAKYILDSSNEVIHLSIQELSRRSGSSEASIIRLCKSIGLKGYQDLKVSLAADLATQNSQMQYSDIRPNAPIHEIIQSVAGHNLKSLEDTLRLVDEKAMELAADALRDARRIDFYGVGASHLVCHDAQLKFMRIEKLATAYSDSHLQITSAVNLRKGDVAVGVSYSGQTIEIVQALQAAKKAGATAISITSVGESPVNQLADIQLFSVAHESGIRSAAMSSRFAQLLVVDILYSCVASRMYETVVDRLETTRVALQVKKFKH